MWTEGSSLNYENWKNDEYNALYQKVIGEFATDANGNAITRRGGIFYKMSPFTLFKILCQIRLPENFIDGRNSTESSFMR